MKEMGTNKEVMNKSKIERQKINGQEKEKRKEGRQCRIDERWWERKTNKREKGKERKKMRQQRVGRKKKEKKRNEDEEEEEMRGRESEGRC